MSWNKYDYIEQLKDFIRNDCGENASYEEIENYIRDDVDRECIYTSDCWDIAKELSDLDIAPVAYDALLDYVYSQIDIDDLVDELAVEEDEDDEEDDFEESAKLNEENEYGETLYRFVIGNGTYQPDVYYAYGYNEQDALDVVIDNLEKDGITYDINEIEELQNNEEIYEDEYVIGGNHGVALVHYGEFVVTPVDDTKVSKFKILKPVF